MNEVNLFYQQLVEQSDENYIKVTRCKDCKFFIKQGSVCASHRGMVDADYEGYCSHAESKQKTVILQTNADRIRAMSDEELAEVLRCLPEQVPPDGENCTEYNCYLCTVNWLKQEG